MTMDPQDSEMVDSNASIPSLAPSFPVMTNAPTPPSRHYSSLSSHFTDAIQVLLVLAFGVLVMVVLVVVLNCGRFWYERRQDENKNFQATRVLGDVQMQSSSGDDLDKSNHDENELI